MGGGGVGAVAEVEQHGEAGEAVGAAAGGAELGVGDRHVGRSVAVEVGGDQRSGVALVRLGVAVPGARADVVADPRHVIEGKGELGGGGGRRQGSDLQCGSECDDGETSCFHTSFRQRSPRFRNTARAAGQPALLTPANRSRPPRPGGRPAGRARRCPRRRRSRRPDRRPSSPRGRRGCRGRRARRRR